MAAMGVVPAFDELEDPAAGLCWILKTMGQLQIMRYKADNRRNGG